jgi:hypothetical protein
MNNQCNDGVRLSRTRWNVLRAVSILWHANFVVPLLVLCDPIAAVMAAVLALAALLAGGLRLHAGIFLNAESAVWGERRPGTWLLGVSCLSILAVLCAVDAFLRPLALPHAGQLLCVSLAFWLLQGFTGRALEQRHARRVAAALSTLRVGE